MASAASAYRGPEQNDKRAIGRTDSLLSNTVWPTFCNFESAVSWKIELFANLAIGLFFLGGCSGDPLHQAKRIVAAG